MAPVYAAEPLCWEAGEEVGQVFKGQDFGAVDQVEGEVVAGRRTMGELSQLKAEGAGAGFDEKGRQGWGSVGGSLLGRLFCRCCARGGLIDSPTKAVIGNGLEQVVGGVKIEAFKGVVFISGGKDDFALASDEPGNVKAVKFRHLDVEQKEICWVVAEVLQAVNGVGKGGGERKVGVFVDIDLQEFDGQRLVVDDDGFHGVGLSDCRKGGLISCSTRGRVFLLPSR